MEKPQTYEMPNGEILEVWNDGDLATDLDDLNEDFHYYYNAMENIYGIELKP